MFQPNLEVAKRFAGLADHLHGSTLLKFDRQVLVEKLFKLLFPLLVVFDFLHIGRQLGEFCFAICLVIDVKIFQNFFGFIPDLIGSLIARDLSQESFLFPFVRFPRSADVMQLASSHDRWPIHKSLTFVDPAFGLDEELIDVRRNQLSLVNLRRHFFNRFCSRTSHLSRTRSRSGCFTIVRRIGIHQFLNLVTSQRSAKVRHCPACFEHCGLVVVHVVHQKFTSSKTSKDLFHFAFVETRTSLSRGPFKPFENASLVTFGLQTAEEPCSRIGQTFVIKVDRVLSRQDTAEPECTCLFQQR